MYYDYATWIEGLWFLALVFFSIVIVFGKNMNRGLAIKVGSLLLIISYLGLTQESFLSFTEIETLRWGVRVGITFILYDISIRTKIKNPKDFIHSLTNKIINKR